MKYSQKQAIKLAQYLEPIVLRHNAHIAVGGSTIMKGESDKDFDIFVYPRHGCWPHAQIIISELESLGWKLEICNIQDIEAGLANDSNPTGIKPSSVDKQYAMWITPRNYRVDMFFLSNVSIPSEKGCDDGDIPF